MEKWNLDRAQGQFERKRAAKAKVQRQESVRHRMRAPGLRQRVEGEFGYRLQRARVLN